MPTWDANQYLRFRNERERPCRDLVERIAIDRPGAIIDLGCGPGNSAAILAKRWPAGAICGIDSSAEMIAAARQDCLARDYRVGDISTWAAAKGETCDLVFSNAAFQWVADHALLLPQLMAHVAPGGALAVQIPGNYDAPARQIANPQGWRDQFAGGVREWNVHDLPFYYDVLAPLAASLDLWSTEYIHVMGNAEAILEWYKGTGLRPFLDRLRTEARKQAFEAEYCGGFGTPTRPVPMGACFSRSAGCSSSRIPRGEDFEQEITEITENWKDFGESAPGPN